MPIEALVQYMPGQGENRQSRLCEQAAASLSNQPCAALISRGGDIQTQTGIAAALTHLENQNGVARVVVLTHPWRLNKWRDAILKSRPNATVALSTGPMGSRWRMYATTPAQWILVPYSTLIRDDEALLPAMPDSLLVIDHALAVKNRRAQRTVAASRLLQASARRLTLLPPPTSCWGNDWNSLLQLAFAPGRDDVVALRGAADQWNRAVYNRTATLVTVTKND